jgi:hypothetical protein
LFARRTTSQKASHQKQQQERAEGQFGCICLTDTTYAGSKGGVFVVSTTITTSTFKNERLLSGFGGGTNPIFADLASGTVIIVSAGLAAFSIETIGAFGTTSLVVDLAVTVVVFTVADLRLFRLRLTFSPVSTLTGT